MGNQDQVTILETATSISNDRIKRQWDNPPHFRVYFGCRGITK